MHKHILLLLIGLTCILCSACENKKETNQVTNEINNTEATVIVQETQSETQPTEKRSILQLSNEPLVVVFDHEQKKVSSDWRDMDLKIDDIIYEYPYDGKELKERGWIIDGYKESYPEGYQMDPGDKSIGLLQMSNKQNDMKIKASFVNIGGNKCNLDNANIWAINIKKGNKNPNIVIAKKIKFGANKEAIEKAFGEPNVILKENNYIIYKYNDGPAYMNLSINETGLFEIAFKKQRIGDS